MTTARKLLLAAVCALPSSLWATGGRQVSVITPVVPSFGGATLGAVAPVAMPQQFALGGELARALPRAQIFQAAAQAPRPAALAQGHSALAKPLAQASGRDSGAPLGEIASLRVGERLATTVEGSRRFWDLAAPAASLPLAQAAAEPAPTRSNNLAPATARAARADGNDARATARAENSTARAEREAPSVAKPGRWARMKTATKEDFVALKAGIITLKNTLVFPRSFADVKANAKAVGRLLSEIKRLGWRVIGAVVLYYLIRDSILYVLLPYLIFHGVFR